MEVGTSKPQTPLVSPAEPVVEQRTNMVTFRAVLLALILMPINALWLVHMETIRYQGHPTTISLFFNVVFIFVVIIFLNGLLKRIWPRAVLTSGELLCVYIMLTIASALGSYDMIQSLTPVLAHANYYAPQKESWATDILPYIPKWLSVYQKMPLQEFYLGHSTLYKAENIFAWLRPVLFWTGFLTTLGFMMLCINTLLRKQWTESEKLSYPLVTLPLELVSEKSQIFRNKAFWWGVGIVSFLELWNGIATLVPSVPLLPLKQGTWNLGSAFTTAPWNALGFIPVAFYPLGFAMGMLLPVDLLFSTWFFNWVWRFEAVAGSAWGLSTIRGFPFVREQSIGAYAGLAIFALYISRNMLGRVFKSVFNKSIDLQDKDEPMGYRWALMGLALGSVLIFAFCYFAGMSPLMIAIFFIIYFTIAIAVTRMRAELGPPAHDLWQCGADTIIPSLTQSNLLRRGDLTMFTMFYGFNRAYRSHPMPFQLEGFKMAERTHGRYKPLLWAMLIATVFGALFGFWAELDQCYRHGAATPAWFNGADIARYFGDSAWGRMEGWIKTPAPSDLQRNTSAAIFGGIASTLLLCGIRLKLPWFPLHPAGYAVSGGWSIGLLWFPLMMAWLVKLTILRYGGLKAYQKALPLFLGIIVGECVMASFWVLTGIIFHIPTYNFWP
ncbi:MAG: DUF6785 family protein [bacterium]